MPIPLSEQQAKPLIYGERSILAWQQDAKGQTRRLIKPQPEGLLYKETGTARWENPRWYVVSQDSCRLSITLFEPKPQPYTVGDLLWIREALRRLGNGVVGYAADDCLLISPNDGVFVWQWKRDKLPAMFMPRWACRYYAKVVSVRPERLIDIGDKDAIAEGTLIGLDLCSLAYRGDAHNLYHDWWDSLHKKLGTRSQDDPWVWVYGLEAHDPGAEIDLPDPPEAET